MTSEPPILELHGITKSFGPVSVLKGVDLSLNRGEVHALIGENGAGKSTLMKIISGAYTADGGEVRLQGHPHHAHNPLAGRKAGIAMIYQELTLAPHLSVLENVCLGIEESVFGFERLNRSEVESCFDLLGHPDLNLDLPVQALPISLRQCSRSPAPSSPKPP